MTKNEAKLILGTAVNGDMELTEEVIKILMQHTVEELNATIEVKRRGTIDESIRSNS